MKNLTVSIFGNKVFLEILKELNLFKNTEIKFIENVEDEILNKVLSGDSGSLSLSIESVEHFIFQHSLLKVESLFYFVRGNLFAWLDPGLEYAPDDVDWHASCFSQRSR